MTRVTGFGVGSKSGTGRALFLTDTQLEPQLAEALDRSPGSTDFELTEFNRSLAAVTAEFTAAISNCTDPTLREILSAQLALLQDDELAALVAEEISAGESAAAAISKTVDIFTAALADATGAFKERIADLEEIKARLMEYLTSLHNMYKRFIRMSSSARH